MKIFYSLIFLVVFLHNSQALIEQSLTLYECDPENFITYGDYFEYDDCFSLLQSEVVPHIQTAIGSYSFIVNLTIGLSITFNVTESNSIINVCEDYFFLDSGSKNFVPGEHIESQLTANLPTVSALTPPENSLQGKFYTLIMMETDVYFDYGSNIIHWMKANIEGADFISSGETLMDYYPVAPYNWSYRQVVFLVFEQLQRFDDPWNFLEEYVNNHFVEGVDYIPQQLSLLSDGESRALFELDNFVVSNNLVLVGTTWYNTETDAYSVSQWLDSGEYTEPDACCWINICCWTGVYDMDWQLTHYERCDMNSISASGSQHLLGNSILYEFAILLFISILTPYCLIINLWLNEL